MANTFTNILPVLAKAAQTVSREAIGLCKSVNLDTSDQGASLGQTVNVPKSPTASPAAWTPSLAPALADTTATGVQLALSLAYEAKWHVTAEQSRGMDAGDANAVAWFERQAAQGMRALANQIEAYLAGIAYKASSRALGTAGTTPFGSNLDDAAQLARILNDNGAPMGDRRLVLSPAAWAEAQERLSSVSKTTAGGLGELVPMAGMAPILSNQLAPVTVGTGTGYLGNVTAGQAIGATSLVLDTGSGTLVPGDVILMGTAGRMYVVKTALSAGTVVINDPGLKVAIANNVVVTRQASYTPNLALTPDAIYAIIRAPLQPSALPNGWESTIVRDDVSGIPFGVLSIPGDGVTHYSVRALYGAVAVESGHIATLMG